MSLVVVVLLSPSLCRLHHTFCIPAPCSPSSNSHILSLLGIVTVICVSPYPMHSPAQLLYCHYKHTPPPRLIRSIFPPPHLVHSTMLHSLYLTPLVTLNSNVILCCMLCVDQAGPCLFHLYLCSVFALQDCPPTPPALFPIPGVSVHNLELPINFIHCPIQHAHTCVRP